MESKFSFPTGSDKKKLSSILTKGIDKRVQNLENDHNQFDLDVKSQTELIKPFLDFTKFDSRELEKIYLPLRKQNQLKHSKLISPGTIPLKAHNPIKYAPYDLQWNWVSGGGLTAIDQRYGPDASTGSTGYSIGVWNGGSVSSVSSIGFWYYAQSSGTLTISVNAQIWFRGFVFSLFFGYAYVKTGIGLYVQSDNESWESQHIFYESSGILATSIPILNWETRTVSISVPVRAGRWYSIWADCIQTASAGGIADAANNANIYMGPIRFNLD